MTSGTANNRYDIKKSKVTPTSTVYKASRENPLPGQALMPPTYMGSVEEYCPNILIGLIQDGITYNLASKTANEIHNAWNEAVQKRKKHFVYEVYSIPNKKTKLSVFKGQPNIRY